MKTKRRTNGSLYRKPPAPNLHAVYEQLKASLPADLTAEQHAAACQRIAKMLRI